GAGSRFHLSQKMLRQQRDVLLSMAQRRQLNEYHLDPIKNIRAHLSVTDLIVQGGIGSRNKPKISGNSLRAAIGQRREAVKNR
ncbi:MAG: hypothetical protein PHS48_03535, partial [Bacteroidales bacterium]|nr:hypothetical protein [Bacteroidales bacterium]